jgi:hypothetical protein
LAQQPRAGASTTSTDAAALDAAVSPATAAEAAAGEAEAAAAAQRRALLPHPDARPADVEVVSAPEFSSLCELYRFQGAEDLAAALNPLGALAAAPAGAAPAPAPANASYAAAGAAGTLGADAGTGSSPRAAPARLLGVSAPAAGVEALLASPPLLTVCPRRSAVPRWFESLLALQVEGAPGSSTGGLSAASDGLTLSPSVSLLGACGKHSLQGLPPLVITGSLPSELPSVLTEAAPAAISAPCARESDGSETAPLEGSLNVGSTVLSVAAGAAAPAGAAHAASPPHVRFDVTSDSLDACHLTLAEKFTWTLHPPLCAFCFAEAMAAELRGRQAFFGTGLLTAVQLGEHEPVPPDEAAAASPAGASSSSAAAAAAAATAAAVAAAGESTARARPRRRAAGGAAKICDPLPLPGLRSDCSVGELKMHVFQARGDGAPSIVYFRGQQLPDALTLVQAGILDGDTVFYRMPRVNPETLAEEPAVDEVTPVCVARGATDSLLGPAASASAAAGGDGAGGRGGRGTRKAESGGVGFGRSRFSSSAPTSGPGNPTAASSSAAASSEAATTTALAPASATAGAGAAGAATRLTEGGPAPDVVIMEGDDDEAADDSIEL